jgi:hypothetical protein
MDAGCIEVALGQTKSLFEHTNFDLPVTGYMIEEVVYNRNATTRILRNADDFRLPRYKKISTQQTPCA